MAETTVLLNPGSGGSSVAVYADSTSRVHEEVVIQTQNGSSDPVSVGSANPLPVVQAGPLQAGSNAIGTVALNAAIPAGSNVIGAVTQSGTWAVTGNVPAGGADSGNGIKVSAVYNTTAPSLSNGQRGDLQVDASGNLKVNIAAGQNAGGTSSNFSAAFPAAGTAIGGQQGSNMAPLLLDGSGNLKVNIAAGGVAAATDNSVFSAGASAGLPIMAVYNDSVSNAASGDVAVPRMTVNRQMLVALQATVNGGWTPYHLIGAATTNATSVKGSAGQIGAIYATNSGTGWVYLKLYNSATAPTVGTTVPVHTIGLPPGGGGSLPVPAGIAFSTGIALSLNGGIADTDATAITASTVAVNIDYL